MIKLSNYKMIPIFTKLLMLLVIAKAISLFALWYFPSNGVELNIKENYLPKYQRVDFKNMIVSHSVKKFKSSSHNNAVNITNMVLKGLYGVGNKGFAIIAMKSNEKKTSIIGIGENYQGYILKYISSRSVTFTKNGSDFVLSLVNIKNSSAVTKFIKSEESSSVVSRKDIAYYSKNPNKIWKNISLQEVMKGKKINGFKVTKISSNSKFASLGLKKGDVIIKANNIIIKSYRDAMEIYKNIDNLDTIQIVVIRDNKEVELEYEIN